MSKNLNRTQVTISGVVTAAEWDEAERIQEVSVSATDEQEYLVEPDKIGKELFRCVHSQVKVTGWVTSSDCGKKRIRVTRYQLIREYDQERGNICQKDLSYSR